MAVVASCVGFVLIGALQALYGPAIPALRTDFGVSASGASLALSAHFLGGVTGVLAFQRMHGRLGNRMLVAAAYLLMAIGGILFAIAPWWPMAVGAAVVMGLGFGGIDYGLNQLFAVGFGHRSPAMLNILNAHFGVGAIAGPALISVFRPERYAAIFIAFAVLSLLLMLTVRGIRDHDDTDDAPVVAASGGIGRTGRMILTAFVGLYVLNVAVESGIGGWEPTHVESLGHTAAYGAAATSVYWFMLTLGRFLVAPLALRWRPSTIIVWSCAGMAVCLLLAPIPQLTVFAYAGVGLFIAPVFPTGLPWLARGVPQVQRAGGYLVAASMIGGVAFPPLLGMGIEWWGVVSIPWTLFILTAVSLGMAVWLRRAVGVD
jgi:fucose permease